MTKFGRFTIIKLVGTEIRVNDRMPGAEDLTIQLEAMDVRIRDFREPFDDFGAHLVKNHIPRQFRRRGFPRRWAPLSPSYAAWKRRKYGNLPLLVLTGRMKAGFRHEATKRTVRIINRVRAGQKSGLPRYLYHQYGTEKMPARPAVQLRRKERALLSQLVERYLRKRPPGGGA